MLRFRRISQSVLKGLVTSGVISARILGALSAAWLANTLPAFAQTPMPTTSVTPTATPTATPLPTVVHIDIGAAVGRPGDAVAVTVSLRTSGLAVAGTANDITFDPRTLALDPDACAVNAAIEKAFVPSVVQNSAEAKTLRFFVQSVESADPIPDGPLYTCTLRIAQSAPLGTYTLTIGTTIAFSTEALPLPNVAGTDGSVRVELMPPSPTPGACVGDCNGDGDATVDELLILVNIALDNAEVAACPAGDANTDGQVTVDEILWAVDNVLNDCRLTRM